MTAPNGKIFIGTILLERNRWTPEKQPTYLVSEWIERFREAGFDGVELWQNHAAGASLHELAALTATSLPISVFNSYIDFSDAAAEERQRIARLVQRLGANAVKFNLGRADAERAVYVRNVLSWRAQLPMGTQLLCECHSGTIMEEPARAASILAEWGLKDIQAIVHPFSVEPRTLYEWFQYLGSSITHAHVQLRDAENRFMRLDRQPSKVKHALRILREAGFQGSFTLEFTQGVAAQSENMEALFQSARADLRMLKENWV